MAIPTVDISPSPSTPPPTWVATLLNELRQLRIEVATNRNMLNQLLNNRPTGSNRLSKMIPDSSNTEPGPSCPQ